VFKNNIIDYSTETIQINKIIIWNSEHQNKNNLYPERTR